MSKSNKIAMAIVCVLAVIIGLVIGLLIKRNENTNKLQEPVDITTLQVDETTDTTTYAPTDYNPALDSKYQSTEDTTEDTTEETEEPSAVAVTGVEVDPSTAKTMYTITNVNVRTNPSMEGTIITTLYTGKEIQVCEVGNPEWAVVILDGAYYYINKNFIADTPPQTAAPETAAPVRSSQPADKTGDFHYYGIWTGQYWHFTPEQIDNQWNGYKTQKPALSTGTTRAWQAYLYQKLSERGFSWWYKYACAQAMQESGFNPLADNGVDYGLFSFRLRYWNNSYGSVYDYHANINAYVDRISKYLVGVSTQNDIYMALSQHYLPDGQLHMNYVNAVLGRLNELWICD